MGEPGNAGAARHGSGLRRWSFRSFRTAARASDRPTKGAPATMTVPWRPSGGGRIAGEVEAQAQQTTTLKRDGLIWPTRSSGAAGKHHVTRYRAIAGGRALTGPTGSDSHHPTRSDSQHLGVGTLTRRGGDSHNPQRQVQ